MRRTSFALTILIACCGVLWGASTAGEEPHVEIEFDLPHSVIAAGGLIEIPPDGAVDSGTLRLTIPVTQQGDPIPGPVEISDLSFSLTADASPLFATVTGQFAVVQQGIATGDLSDTVDEVALSSPLFLDRSGTISCSGFFCWLFADAFPLVLAGVEALPSATLRVANLRWTGSATISDTLAVTMNSGTAIFRMLGEEKRRTYVPEPGATEMIAAGGAALALLRLRQRAMRAQRPESAQGKCA
jgi:hypothetical protein